MFAIVKPAVDNLSNQGGSTIRVPGLMEMFPLGGHKGATLVLAWLITI